MLRNALIALYILAVLAISAVTRAEEKTPVVVEPKRPVTFVFKPFTVDPLPGFGATDAHMTVMLDLGIGGVTK